MNITAEQMCSLLLLLFFNLQCSQFPSCLCVNNTKTFSMPIHPGWTQHLISLQCCLPSILQLYNKLASKNLFLLDPIHKYIFYLLILCCFQLFPILAAHSETGYCLSLIYLCLEFTEKHKVLEWFLCTTYLEQHPPCAQCLALLEL